MLYADGPGVACNHYFRYATNRCLDAPRQRWANIQSIQQRIISILLNKLKKAVLQTGVTNICLAGGVSANSGLRKAFEELGTKNNWKTFIPAFEYCTDNAAMIAITGYYKYLAGQFSDLSVSATARAEWWRSFGATSCKREANSLFPVNAFES